ncbi:hypothetical protein FRC06_004468 [Ceratobasidium sp. 370]|nr:hypothetical protein FRC06_004468 [Ceratobasidium sp. 370]
MPPQRTRNSDPVVEKPGDKLAIHGRQLTRMVDMFWCPNELLTLGKKLHSMSAQAELNLQNTASEKTKELLVLLDKLNTLDPELMTRLTQGGLNVALALMRDARKQLSSGQSNAKSEDMRKVKENIGKWQDWTPPMPDSDDMAQRGLNHDGCAYELSEPTLNWENEEARTQFKSFGNPAMDPSAWGRFLRPHGQYDPTRPSLGLLRGELLVRAGKAILLSPATANTRSATPGTGSSMGTRGKRRHGTIGLAKSYQLTEVTPAFIAYVAVVVRHALTSDEFFSENCAGFDYIEFYTQIREFLEAPKYRHRSAALLKWWNEQIFSDYKLLGTNAPSNRRQNGTLASLEAELEEELDNDNGNGGRGVNGGGEGESWGSSQ